MHAAIALVEKVVVVILVLILVLVIIFVLVVLVLVIVFQLNAVVAAIELLESLKHVPFAAPPLQFDAGFHVSVGLQCALDAPTKFRKYNVHFLWLPVCNVVLYLHHELLYGGEFGRIQLQFGQLFQNGLHLRLTLRLRSVR